MTPKARQEAIELLLRFACSVAEAHPAGAGALVGSLRSTEAGEEGTVFVAMYPTLSKLLLEFKDHQELSPTQGSLVFHILQVSLGTVHQTQFTRIIASAANSGGHKPLLHFPTPVCIYD